LLTIEDLEEILDRNFGEGVEFVPEYLNEATTEQLLTRLLRNLKMHTPNHMHMIML